MKEADIAGKAVGMIPAEIDSFLSRVSSPRTRLLLQLRESESLYYCKNTKEALGVALVRLFASELIGKAGVKSIGKSKKYNDAKLTVRAGIIKYLNSHKEARSHFDSAVEARQRGLPARAMRTIRKIKKSKPSPRR